MATRTTQRPPRAPLARQLNRYRAKRDLTASGEPDAETAASRVKLDAIRRFVIQKHDATRMHYDFRLEMDGVLRSWAVPKGLPEKPGERVLAVEVEDHPLEYGSFEGVIPEGNYGAGTVMLWDRGSYTVADGDPESAYRKGKIHLALAGEKCVGEWTLVRMRPRPGDKKNNWLVIKNSGPVHRAAMTGKARDHSVSSGRTMDEIAHARGVRTWKSGAGAAKRRKPAADAARKKAPPSRARRQRVAAGDPARFVPPMKALSVDVVPAGKWRLEIKLDGYRAVAVINNGEVELWSRNHKPLTSDYPEVGAALAELPCTNAVIDGEIVAVDDRGRSRFQLLQQRGMARRPNLIYYVFDLMHQDGRSLTDLPIEERQRALEALVGAKPGVVRFSTVFDSNPEELLAAARQQGLEGIIAKRPGSRYEPDSRSGAWLKCKVHGEQEFVIGGFTPPKNSRPNFGAILVGYYQDGKLRYAGKVGSGLGHALLAELHAAFKKRQVDAAPFADPPREKGVTWIKPELVGQVRFAEWTDEGLLRQPVFLGLRHDKPAKEVRREAGPVTP